MIKINLIAKRRARKRDPGQESLLVGLLAVGAVAALVFFFVHSPLKDDIAALQKTNAKLSKKNKSLKSQVADFNSLKTSVKSLRQRMAAIEVLDSARATPAYFMYELDKILTPGSLPTMTTSMAREIKTNPNRRLAEDWDPKHVWLTSLVEKKGRFIMKGGAQSDGDMTQLAMRLQASLYFENVIPEGGVEANEKAVGVTYYRFTITGKVVY